MTRGPVAYCLGKPGPARGECGWSRSHCAAAPHSLPWKLSLKAAGSWHSTAKRWSCRLTEGQGLYAEVGDAELVTAPVRLIPYFTWGNRGASEMSVWLPLAW